MALVNYCLAANGGALEDSANDAMRDNDFATTAVSLGLSQGAQSLTSSITFSARHIAEIIFRGTGSGTASNGNGHMIVYLNIGGSWTQVYRVDGTGASAAYDSGTNTISTGWDDVSGIRMVSNTTPTGGAYAQAAQQEIQAWGGAGGSYGGII